MPIENDEPAALSSLFGAVHYRQQLRDRGQEARAALDDEELAADYAGRGWREGLDPSEDFSTNGYLEIYDEAREANRDPLSFWLEQGQTMGHRPVSPAAFAAMPHGAETQIDPLFKLQWRTIAPHVDEEYYRATYPESQASDVTTHYLIEGAVKDYNPRADFDTADYIAANPDVRDSGLNAFVHWIAIGRDEDRPLKPPRQQRAITPRPMPRMTLEEEALVRAAFDDDFYRGSDPALADLPGSAFEHYMTIGWQEGRNPNREFSTEYYLTTNREIAQAGINPFQHYVLHGRQEKRDPNAYYVRNLESFRPLVSVIVPNFNHARYLPQRLESIFRQTYRNIELLILDDASTDDSTAVIEALVKESPFPCHLLFNKQNAGNVSRQWRKGIAAATGDLIWICESDDFCEPAFLEKLVRYFADRSVMMAFGRIQLTNEAGEVNAWLDEYREQAEPGIWSAPLVRPACEWFSKGFGVNNLIANVGGCVFRNIAIAASVWERAQQYRIVGDWYLYSRLAGGGRIAYDPEAIAYFRQHQKNTSAGNFDKLYYYRELEMVLADLSALWPLPAETRDRFVANVRAQYEHHNIAEREGAFDVALPGLAGKPRGRVQEHILIAMLGFSLGGGEIFAIHLANALARSGVRVSIMAFSMNTINPALLDMLDRRIPVYDRGTVLEHGVKEFLPRAGISLVHSHMISCDDLFFGGRQPLEGFPYVVTLHGSHDTAPPTAQGMLFRALRGVAHWVYLADKNLEMFRGMPLDGAHFSKIANAMPPDPRPFPQSREELGIGPETIVFTMASRGIQRKGWRAAAIAFLQLLEDNPKADVHLLLAGEGEYAELAAKLLAGCPKFTWLGFQSNISGLYRMSDCAIVPTRYGGESFPLTIVQALQEGLPVIATDIGEISNMITARNGGRAGILLPNLRDSERYFGFLREAMESMLQLRTRRRFASIAKKISVAFSMELMVNRYLEVYTKARHRVDSSWSISNHPPIKKPRKS